MALKESLNRIELSNIVISISDSQRKELQNVLLEMYSDILSVCKKYKIIPYLGGGSALGAIRHKGFIPWDDDLDINMTRSDYKRFCKVFNKELSEKYILCAPNYSKESITRFPKIIKKNTKFVEIVGTKNPRLQGVFLDIFIIENVPMNKLHRVLKGYMCNLLEFIAGRVQMYKDSDDDAKKLLKKTGVSYYINRFVGFLFSFKSAYFWNDLVDKSVRYNKKSKLCNMPTGRKHYFGEIFEKTKLFPEVYVDFENIKAPVFKGYDYYLKNLYGDYMVIPQKNKREKHFVKEIKL